MTRQERKNLAFDIATATLAIRAELERECPNAWKSCRLIEVERRLHTINEMAREMTE